MRLYRGKVPVIAQEVIQFLIDDGSIEVDTDNKVEAEQDIKSIMDDYLRRERRLRSDIQDFMASRKISYDRYGEIRKMKAQEHNHPIGDKVMSYLASQFTEMFMNSASVEEVYADDKEIRGKVFGILKKHNVNESELREEAKAKLKHLKEDSLEFQIRFPEALQEIRRKHGLL
jgi:hypothetical protein